MSGNTEVKTLRDACAAVMNDTSLGPKYPNGLNPSEILAEIHEKFPGGFPLVTVIDVADAMNELYGPPRS